MKISKYNKRTFALFTILALYILLPTNNINAEIVRDVNIAKLTNSSQFIILGKCLTSYSEWNSENSEIYTYTIIEVLESLKGDAETPLAIETLGGKVGHIISTVIGAPKFIDGAKSLFFLFQKRSGQLGIVGLNQGKFNAYLKNGTEFIENPHTKNIILTDNNNNTVKTIELQDKITLQELIRIVKTYTSTLHK